MTRLSRAAALALALGAGLALVQGPARASEAGAAPDHGFSFEGPLGRFDTHQLQRGLQVYTEVCAACHGLKYVPIRSLSDEGGPQLPAEQVRAYAAQFSVNDEGANPQLRDPESGDLRPLTPNDHFPANTMQKAPDLSLMAKARANFHGPYGSGFNQLLHGIGGPEHIYGILTGYTGETKDEAGTTYYENHAFSTGWISMPPPLTDDLVTYADGTPATTAQMAEDVASFLMWAAEPKLMARKQVGLVAVLFLGLLSVLLWLTNKRIWAGVKGRKSA